MSENAEHKPLKIGISSCLIGQEVRFDGGHKHSSIPHDKISELFEFVPRCPEVAIGLGIPRDPIRLVQTDQGTRVRGIADPQLDVTDALREYGRTQSQEMTDIHGYVFMKNSPSCGLHRIKVYNEAGAPLNAKARGAYADEFALARPELPIEESGRLFDATLLENFATRVLVHARYKMLLAEGLTAKRLIEFHSAHKYLVMAHSNEAYKALGRMLSDLSTDLELISEQYFLQLMQALAQPASRGGHANVLSHLQGYVKKHITTEERQALKQTIDDYRLGSVPLLAPIVLLKHHLQRVQSEYALSQIYLDPHPGFIGLRRDL